MSFKNKTLMVAVGFLISFSVLIVFVIVPLGQQTKTRSDIFFAVRKELLSLEEKSKKLPIVQEEYSNLGTDRERVKALFVSPENPLEFLEFLEIIASRANIRIEISLLTEKEKEETLPSLGFQINLTGSFSNCLRFLGKLETLPYLISIERINSVRLTENQLRSKAYQNFSLGDARFDLSIKVLTNNNL